MDHLLALYEFLSQVVAAKNFPLSFRAPPRSVGKIVPRARGVRRINV